MGSFDIEGNSGKVNFDTASACDIQYALQNKYQLQAWKHYNSITKQRAGTDNFNDDKLMYDFWVKLFSNFFQLSFSTKIMPAAI